LNDEFKAFPELSALRQASDIAPPVRRSLDEGGSYDGQAGQAVNRELFLDIGFWI
jgi:hypothetical protein